VPDELIGNLGDTHLYSNHIEQAKEQISREPFDLPKLKTNAKIDGICCNGPDDFELIGHQSHSYLDKFNLPKRAISLMWNQRSVDTFLGLPFNIASYGLLLEILAKEVNMVPDELIGNLGDVHLYSNHIEQAKEQINRTSFDLPTVQITERNWYQHEAVKEHLGPKTFKDIILSYRPDCFELIGYESQSGIKAPLSN
jgi:thymidylate synthase